jgi:hypothetical protein
MSLLMPPDQAAVRQRPRPGRARTPALADPATARLDGNYPGKHV